MLIFKWIPKWVYFALVVFAIGTVWLRLYIVQSTYHIDQKDKIISNLQKNIEKVKLDVEELKSPKKLEALAQKKFQLSPAHPSQVIIMQPKD